MRAAWDERLLDRSAPAERSSAKKASRTSALAALLWLCAVGSAAAGNHVFDSGFEERAEGPHSDAAAARFLTQATFGPTQAEIARLRGMGYHAWLDEQFAMPATRHLPYLQAQAASGISVYQNSRQEAWWLHSLTAPDQLRQRVAFALSEVLVVSDRSTATEGAPMAMAHYYDVLAANAFGNYRGLLEDVTLNPVMAHYLSMFKNRKPDAALNIRPDENYAREIMQLFSVGLVHLHADGRPVLVGGQPVPTYGQETIRGFAHTFTGWNWANCPRTQGGQPWEWQWCPPGPVNWPAPGWDAWWLEPIEEWENYHASEGSKQLLDYTGVALPAGVLPAGGTARGNLATALDNLFLHPNVGPFLAQHLIKRLITSNPSPAYVARVAGIFANNGSGVRGDLGATVRAVLMDGEAHSLQPAGSHAGKLREPLLRLTQLWRAQDGRADDGRYREWNPEFYLGQAALRSPSVFNFFQPDYSPTGELQDLGLLAPEFQITTDTTIASIANAMEGKIYWAWRGNPNAGAQDILIDLGPQIAIAADAVRLVDHYDLVFMSRTMSPTMFNALVTHVQALPTTATGRRQRAQDALWLTLTSPEYVIER